MIDSYDNVVRTRYVPTGAHSRPEEQALGDFCQYLDESVGDHLAASGYPIRVKHSFSQPTAPTSVTDHVSEDIETLSSKEREILAYLLHHNQCLFTCAADGGHAATLTSRAIVHRALKQGQIFDYLDMPVEIPIEVWRFLRENVEKSPCEGAEDEPHPWRRKHWME